MHIRPVGLVLVLALLVPIACANPRGVTKVANALGYAVFSNVSMKILVVSTGHGYGVGMGLKDEDDSLN